MKKLISGAWELLAGILGCGAVALLYGLPLLLVIWGCRKLDKIERKVDTINWRFEQLQRGYITVTTNRPSITPVIQPSPQTK